MSISIIVAMDQNRVIGKDNKLPWHISEDLKRFKKITMGSPIIMGRKTYQSIGKPLPGRHNIVLTRKRPHNIEGVTVMNSLQEAIQMFDNEGRGKGELFVIGGSSIFREAYPLATKLYLTLIHRAFEGDTYFPDLDLENEFEIKEKTSHKSSENGGFSFDFITAARKSKN